MRALDDGTSFVVTRNGAAVGELRPLRRHRFVDAQVIVAAFAGAARVDVAQLRRDLDDVTDPSLPDRV